MKQLAEEIYKLTGTKIPSIRTDWFLASASTPPHYHELLNLPKIARAGFTKSGVSANANRFVERHEVTFGAYWISYDFKLSEGKGSLVIFPLGPGNLFAKDKHPYVEHSFDHDGGEVIWNLPNSMQAYFYHHWRRQAD